MTVTVTKMPGGITQLFNTETGRVTYKCKAESGLMLIEAFGGIVKFNHKGAMATVTGAITTLDSCNVIKENDPDYTAALDKIIQSHKDHARAKAEMLQKEIQELERKLSSLG
jgi:hypothetical protein